MNPEIEYRVFHNDNMECWEPLPGPWVGGLFDGSFIGYVCDQDTGHDGYHIDSVEGVAWSSSIDVHSLALMGADPVV